MNLAMFNRAKALLEKTPTDTVADFESVLAKAGLAVLDSTEGVAFWTATGKQKNDLKAVLKAGTNKAECEKSLLAFCTMPNPSASLSKPFVTDEFNRSGWFDYFYTEANGAKFTDLSPQDQELLQTITCVFFVKRADGQIGLRLPFDEVADGTFRMILLFLLTTGFNRIPATKEQAVAGDTSDAHIIGKLLWAGPADEVASQPNIKVVPVEFKWRGDSRPFGTIKSANGFTTKAASQGYASAKGLTQAWHPFSDDTTRKYLWFRKAATDNCLYSVISVGSNATAFKAYLPYPLIKLSGGKAAKLNGYLGKRTISATPSAGGAVVQLQVPVSETYLYMFVFAGIALDTGAMQGSQAYPEYGVAGIPFKNVYGGLRCVRFHLGDDDVGDDDGLVAVMSTPTVTDDDGLSINASYGQDLFGRMKAAFDQVKNTAAVGVRWQSSGAGYAEFQPLGHEFTHGGVKYKLASVPAA